MDEPAPRRSFGKRKRSLGDTVGPDCAEPAIAAVQQEVAQRRRRDTKPFRWTAIAFALSDQKSGPQYVQAAETHLGQFPFDLTLHFQI